MKGPRQKAKDLVEKHGHDGAVRHCKQVLFMSSMRSGATKTIMYELILDYLSTMHDSEPQKAHSHQHGIG
jgi:hypothetical protein